jgi:hypothetical protein
MGMGVSRENVKKENTEVETMKLNGDIPHVSGANSKAWSP